MKPWMWRRLRSIAWGALYGGLLGYVLYRRGSCDALMALILAGLAAEGYVAFDELNRIHKREAERKEARYK